MKLILRILATAAAVGVAAWLLGGITVVGESAGEKAGILIGVALVFGLVLITLGLFMFVINGLMLMLTGWLSQKFGLGFEVNGFWSAVFGSIIISVVSSLINGLLGSDDKARA